MVSGTTATPMPLTRAHRANASGATVGSALLLLRSLVVVMMRMMLRVLKLTRGVSSSLSFCLVNLTETRSTLSISTYSRDVDRNRSQGPTDRVTILTDAFTVTKAGVPNNKIFVGEASYGRSFHMAVDGCWGPM